jgi:peptidoglycan/LPS O-acetylase OafA/YrhL
MKTGRTRVPALDGLRGVAILSVLLWHGVFGQYFRSPLLAKCALIGKLSWSGVDLFFVLSGFLIGGILLDAKASPRYYQTFYLRRAFRILPFYGALLAVYFALRFTSVGPWFGFDRIDVPAWSLATFTQNVWMAIAGKFGADGLSPTWSLAVEEQFYLTVPILIRILRPKHLVAVLGAAIFIAPALRIFLSLHAWSTAAYVLMPCRADALCMGVLIAVFARYPEVVVSRNWVRVSAIVLLLPLGWLSVKAYDPLSLTMSAIGYSLLGLFYSCCLILALTGEPGFLGNSQLKGLGKIAYATYLLHLPLLVFGRRLALLALGNSSIPHAGGLIMISGVVIGIGASLVLASASWTLFENPLIKRGHAFTY